MVFSSSLFLLYFLPLVLLIYFIADNKYKNIWLLISSLFFYTWGAPKYVFVVVLSIFIDFYIAKELDKYEGRKRKLWVAAALIINVGFLLYFKYFNFFADNINSMLASFGLEQFKYASVILPIGISFFTFHEMSYVIDVYRKVKAPLTKITDYSLYILFFPQLIAGPIIRFNEIAEQIQERSYQDNIDFKLTGAFRFIIGLSKKVLIANVLGAEADKIFALPADQLSTGAAWIGVIAYAFQIYYDFSGYSDMAIGLARMFGFVFPENFNNPYISQNITEFWRRWHITLGRWMRDYLYIPLGGNKVTIQRMYFNLCFVFIISGFWHGAAWNFIVWGAFHGLFLVLDRIILLRFYNFIGKYPSVLITFIITLIGWVFFRSETLSSAFAFIGKMFDFTSGEISVLSDSRFVIIAIIATFFAFITLSKYGLKAESKFLNLNFKPKTYFSVIFLSFVLFVLCVASITSSGFNPFIYFRF